METAQSFKHWYCTSLHGVITRKTTHILNHHHENLESYNDYSSFQYRTDELHYDTNLLKIFNLCTCAFVYLFSMNSNVLIVTFHWNTWWGPGVGSCEHGNESSCSIKGKNYLTSRVITSLWRRALLHGVSVNFLKLLK